MYHIKITDDIMQGLRDLISREIVVDDSRNRYYNDRVISADDLFMDLQKIKGVYINGSGQMTKVLKDLGYRKYTKNFRLDGYWRIVYYKGDCVAGRPSMADIRAWFKLTES